MLERVVAVDEHVLAWVRASWQSHGTATRAAWVACGALVLALAVV